jgi:hypothetical protein
MLVRRHADIAIGGIAYTYARNRAVSFTYPLTFTSTMMTRPDPEPLPLWTACYKPFSPDVWITLAFALLMLGILSTISDQMCHCTKKSKIPTSRYNSFVAILSPFLNDRDWKIGHKFANMASAILYYFRIIGLSVLVYAYSAAILAFLIKPHFGPTIESLEEVLDQTNQPVYIAAQDDAMKNAFMSGDNPIFNKVVKQGRLKYCPTD